MIITLNSCYRFIIVASIRQNKPPKTLLLDDYHSIDINCSDSQTASIFVANHGWLSTSSDHEYPYTA